MRAAALLLILTAAASASTATAGSAEPTLYDRENRAAGRLYLQPTALPPSRGDVRVSQLELVHTQVSVAPAPGVAVDVGLSIPILAAEGYVFGDVGVRYARSLDAEHHVGGAVQVWAAGNGFSNTGWMVVPMGLYTHGGLDRHWTFALGVPVGPPSSQAEFVGGVAAVGGQRRLSERWALVTENWLVVTNELPTVGAVAAGARALGRRVTFDLGLAGLWLAQPLPGAWIELSFYDAPS